MKPALLVIDMVRDFTSPEGSVYYPQNREIIPPINHVLEFCRRMEICVIFLRQSLRQGKPDPAMAGMRPNCIQGSGGDEIDRSISVLPQDYVVAKRRYSGFYGTDLDLILRENKIDTVVLTGTKTNCCVRATAEDAFYRNYKVIVLSDCVATNSEAVQQTHLQDISKYLGTVMSSLDFLEALSQKGGPDCVKLS